MKVTGINNMKLYKIGNDVIYDFHLQFASNMGDIWIRTDKLDEFMYYASLVEQEVSIVPTETVAKAEPYECNRGAACIHYGNNQICNTCGSQLVHFKSKDCKNCKHDKLLHVQEPCYSCTGFDNFEAKDGD